MQITPRPCRGVFFRYNTIMTSIQKQGIAVVTTLLIPAILLFIDETTWPGLLAIWQSPSMLVTDYFAVGGVSAALANLWLTTGLSVWLVLYIKAPFNGLVIAGLFTIAGFAVFGKNPLNVVPVWLGITLYSHQFHTKRSSHTAAYLFGTAIGPVASYFWFAAPVGLLPRIVLGLLAGMLAGYLIPPIASRTIKFHQGMNLYNIGFSLGIIGTLFTIGLRVLGWEFPESTSVDGSYSNLLYLMLSVVFTLLLLIAWRLGVKQTAMKNLLQDDGAKTDFALKHGWSATLLNMSLLGWLSVSIIALLGYELHGPMLAGVLTVVGFGAFGKHVLNVLPVMLGAFLIGFTPWVDAQAVGPSIAILFVTALAPISLKYGVLIAIVAGMLHVVLGPFGLFLQGGFALYNNGFVAGIVAIVVVQGIARMFPIPRRKKRTS